MDDETRIPGPTETMRDLGSLPAMMSQAMDYGAFKAREYFEREGKAPGDDLSLAGHLARFHAKDYLRAHGQFVVEERDVEAEDQVDLQSVPNTGLFLSRGRFQIRILHAQNGRIPAPGASLSRQAYYQQLQESFQFPEDEVDPSAPKPVSLILYWDTTAPYDLSLLRLACPQYGEKTQASVKVWWDERLALIAHTPLAASPQAAADDDLDMQLVDEQATPSVPGEDDDD